MALWKPLLSVIGVSLAMSDEEHEWLLFGTLAIALGFAAWELRKPGSRAPFFLTLGGATLLVLSHLLGEVVWLEITGVLVMASSVLSRWRHRSLAARSTAEAGVHA